MLNYRCLRCGAQYERHFPFCSGCWGSGQLVPLPRRNRAEVDYQPGISTAREVMRMGWGSVSQRVYPELHLGVRSLVLDSGPPGSGKSTFSTRLANAVPGPALLVSAEEGISPTLAARLARCNVRRDDFHIIERPTVDQVVELASKKKVTSLVIDSVQECAWTAAELRHLLSVIPTLDVLVAVMQVTKAGVPAGAMALQHECDVHLVVANMRWSLVKSRYQSLDGVGGDVLPTNTTMGNGDTAMEIQT
jgi:predicted ATP-dependent serine protease